MDDAGKLTSQKNVNYSSLTSDIGTKARLISDSENVPTDPPQYFKGINTWRDAYEEGKQLFDKRYYPNIEWQTYMPKYPIRKTMTGEFMDDGPLASNDFLL